MILVRFFHTVWFLRDKVLLFSKASKQHLLYLSLCDVPVTLNAGSAVITRKCLVNLYFFPIILSWNINTLFFIHTFNISSVLFILVYNIYHFCKYACMNIRSRVISMCIESYVVILILKPVFSFLERFPEKQAQPVLLMLKAIGMKF